MRRKTILAMGVALCLLMVCAGTVLAENIEVVVYEHTDPNMPLSMDLLVPGVAVTLVWMDSPQGPVIVDTVMTDGDGMVIFTGLGEGNPGQIRNYEVRLSTLPDFMPIGATDPELRYSTGRMFKTSSPRSTPNPAVDTEVRQDPPRDAERPSSGPMTTMGNPGGNHRSNFPVSRSKPEDNGLTVGVIKGLIYRDVGAANGMFDDGVDERVQGADVQIEYRDPDQGTTPKTTGSSGVFSDTGKTLIGKGAGNIPPDVFIRFRETVIDPWSEWMQVPITLNVVTGAFEYRKTSTQYAVGGTPQPEPKGSISGIVVTEAAPGNGEADPGETPAAGETVELRDGTTNVFITSAVTGFTGDYTFGDLDAGDYTVAVPGETSKTITLAAGQDAVVNLAIVEDVVVDPDPDDCTFDACAHGALHEVLVETEMWVGATPAGFMVSASLREGCSGGSAAVGAVSLSYQGTAFPGNQQGLDEVLTLEDVRMIAGSGWATVRLRITANARAFADASFGSAPRRLDVTLNGRRTIVCWRFRCETTQPGGRFGTFRVLETVGRDTWAECTDFQVPPVVKPKPKPRPRHKPRRHHKRQKSSGKSSGKSSAKSSGKSRKHHTRSRWQAAKKKVRKAKARKQRHARKRHKRSRRSWSRWRRR